MVWLVTDRSLTGTGAWVGQGPTSDAASPAAFHRRRLRPLQNTYPTHHLESLRMVEAIASFEYLVRNRYFTVVTDHQSLTEMMTQKGLSGRQQRCLTFISQFNFGIQYQTGTKNFFADYLLRIYKGKPNLRDLTLRDHILQGSKTDAMPDTLPLSIDTGYTFSLDDPTDSEHALYYTSDKKPSSTLTSYNSIVRSSPEYLINEVASFAVTSSQTSLN